MARAFTRKREDSGSSPSTPMTTHGTTDIDGSFIIDFTGLSMCQHRGLSVSGVDGQTMEEMRRSWKGGTRQYVDIRILYRKSKEGESRHNKVENSKCQQN